jgi:hypothetical protein
MGQDGTSSLAFGLKTLLTVLRFRLLTTPEIEQKIAICAAIQDCANAWRATSATSGASPHVPSQLIVLSAAVASHLDSTQAVASFIGVLDGFTTSLRFDNPIMTAFCRRTLENAATALGVNYPIPAHICLDGIEQAAPSDVQIIWPKTPDRPARPIERETSNAEINSNQIDPIMLSLHWKLLNIEITAAEICAAIPLLFPALAPELDAVLALQTYDEGRHSRQLLDALRRHGAEHSPQPKTDLHIWQNMRFGGSLAEAICIEQILGEGYSIGTDLCLADMFEERGYPDLAEVHRSVHADEFMHASQGIFWFRKLAGSDADTMIESLEPKFATSPPTGKWFRADLRSEAGFSESQIERQRMLAKPVQL